MWCRCDLGSLQKVVAAAQTAAINYHLPAAIFYGRVFFFPPTIGTDTRFFVIEMGECDGREGGGASQLSEADVPTGAACLTCRLFKGCG